MRRVFELINKNLLFSKLHRINHKIPKTRVFPIITISRELGSQGTYIAERIAKKLGRPWRFYHKDIMDEIVRESHLEKNLIKDIDEGKTSLIEGVVADFFGRRYINLSSYYKHLIRILTLIGNRGYAVVVGRGANFIFPHALKVRIISDEASRIATLIRYDKNSEKIARKRIDESDKKRREFAKTLFQKDHTDPHNFDLVITIGTNLDADQAADIITELAKKRFKLK